MFEALLKRFGYERALPRGHYRRSGPGFGAAQVTRLTADFTTSELSADSELRQDLKNLRARVRKLKNDYGYAKKFVAMGRTNILGETGIDFRNLAQDPDRVEGGKLIVGKLDVFANKLIEDAWWEWGKKQNCTVSRKWTWLDVQQLISDTILTDGEVLIRLVRGFDNPFKFAIQLIESDHLDIELNRQLGNGREIRMGVEFNEWKEAVAYHLLKANPHDNYYPSQVGYKYQRIPANEIVHAFLPRRIGQSRGYPPMATALTQMNMLGKAQEAEVAAVREEACKGGFIEEEGDVEYTGEKDKDGNYIQPMEPGTVQRLRRGEKFVQYDPKHPNGNLSEFTKSTLREIAAGLEFVSYNTYGLDMESVNFASGKLGIEEERLGWKIMQVFTGTHVCVQIFEPWLESTMLAGRIALPFSKFEKFNQPCFTGRRWDFIDPEKEINAIIKQMNAGMTSITIELAKRGMSTVEVFQRIAEDRKLAEQFGLTFKELEPETKALSIEEETLKFKQQAYLGFQRDGTVGDVLANLADLSALTEEAGIPREKSAEAEPWLPIIADGGAVVTGDVVKDKEGDIVGGEADPVEDAATEPTEPEMSEEMKKAEEVKALADAYGVAVRAGTITPTEDDEKFFREKFGLAVPGKVGEAWKKDEGIRRPITLQPNAEQIEAQKPPPMPGAKPGGESAGEKKEEKERSETLIATRAAPDPIEIEEAKAKLKPKAETK